MENTEKITQCINCFWYMPKANDCGCNSKKASWDIDAVCPGYIDLKEFNEVEKNNQE